MELRRSLFSFVELRSYSGDIQTFKAALAASNLQISPFDMGQSQSAAVSWYGSDVRLTFYPQQRRKIRISTVSQSRMDEVLLALGAVLNAFVPAVSAKPCVVPPPKRARLEEPKAEETISEVGVQTPSPENYRNWLLAFYTHFNRSNVDRIDFILNKYRGKEAILINALFQKHLPIKDSAI